MTRVARPDPVYVPACSRAWTKSRNARWIARMTQAETYEPALNQVGPPNLIEGRPEKWWSACTGPDAARVEV